MKFSDYFYMQLLGESLQGLIKNALIEESEGFTLDEYTTEIPSERNKKFYKQRQEIGTTGSFLEESWWDVDKDAVFVKYRINPTFEKKVKVVDLDAKVTTDDHYEILFMFEEAEKHLGDIEEFFGVLTKKEQVELFRTMVKEGTLKVHSNDMSWLFQGVWENASALGFSIYPFTGVKGKSIWSNKHVGEDIPAQPYVTKHIIEAIKTIPFRVSQIVKALRDKHLDEYKN